MYIQFLFVENSNCAVLFRTQLLLKSASVCTSIMKQKLYTEHVTLRFEHLSTLNHDAETSNEQSAFELGNSEAHQRR
jgi:hypothetical protein